MNDWYEATMNATVGLFRKGTKVVVRRSFFDEYELWNGRNAFAPVHLDGDVMRANVKMTRDEQGKMIACTDQEDLNESYQYAVKRMQGVAA